MARYSARASESRLRYDAERAELLRQVVRVDVEVRARLGIGAEVSLHWRQR